MKDKYHLRESLFMIKYDCEESEGVESVEEMPIDEFEMNKLQKSKSLLNK